MNDQHISTLLRERGYEFIRDLSPGFVGARKLIKQLETGREFSADIVDAKESETAEALCLNASNARNWGSKFTTGPIELGFLELGLYYQVLCMDSNDIPLSLMDRGKYAADPASAAMCAAKLSRCLDYVARDQTCHLAICPDSVYINGSTVRLGEFWFCRLRDGRPFFESDDDIILDAIPAAARLFAGPELTSDKAEIGMESDIYSLALLIVFLFTGLLPNDPSLGQPLTPRSIRRLCAAIDEPMSLVLTQALDPRPRKRPFLSHFLDEVDKFAQRVGATLPADYLD